MEIVEMIRIRREQKDWFVTEAWRKKGLPIEQIEFGINNSPVTVYSWNEKQPLTKEHMRKIEGVLEKLGSRFPKIFNNLRWILIDDYQEPSLLGDPIGYPTNGHAYPKWNAFRLFPRGMKLMPHRIQATSNFEGTLVHELTHLIADDFENDWKEKFTWQPCYDSDEWEPKKSPDGTRTVYIHKETGQMAVQSRFPLQPEQCINDYAKQNPTEDICESMVAYIYDPQLLRRISPDKFDILQRHDSQKLKPDVSTTRIPKDQIKLPEIKPETVYYFVKEPQS